VKRALLFLLVVLLAGCGATSRAQKLDERGLKEKKPERAIDLFTQALEVSPHRPEIWLHRGDARVKQGDHDGAISDYTESLRLEPSARTHLHRARARRAKKLFDLALVDLAACVELDPDFEAAAEKERIKVRSAMGDKAPGREDRE
jgi:tetratricopeptide (TPR) repeat protein